MGKRLYVGNLPYDADEDAVRAAFTENGGAVERVHIPLDRETQRPRGFAFVEMATEEQAREAIAAMDGASFGSRTLRVSEAEERRPAGGAAGGPRGGHGGGVRAHGGPRGGAAPSRGATERREPEGRDLVGESSGSGERDPAERARQGRERRFGPDARPRRERRGKGGHGRRRHEDAGDDRGRRGGSRFEDYED